MTAFVEDFRRFFEIGVFILLFAAGARAASRARGGRARGLFRFGRQSGIEIILRREGKEIPGSFAYGTSRDASSSATRTFRPLLERFLEFFFRIELIAILPCGFEIIFREGRNVWIFFFFTS